MSKKVLWIDLETTGTNPIRHAPTQLAALVSINGIIEDEINLHMRPLTKHEVDDEALVKTNRTEDEIRAYPHQSEQFETFKALLERYVNRYEKLDKFVLAGYNISSFDEPFLRELFMDNAATRNERKYGGYFGSYFFWPKRDVQTYLAEHIAENGLRLPNYKLETVCAYFGIPIDAHDALSDIRATRTLYRVLRYSISTAAPAA
jgi:DNA polymerase-3 subunit epsilon